MKEFFQHSKTFLRLSPIAFLPAKIFSVLGYHFCILRFQKENEENNNSSEFDVCLPGSTSGIQNPFMVCATPSS